MTPMLTKIGYVMIIGLSSIELPIINGYMAPTNDPHTIIIAPIVLVNTKYLSIYAQQLGSRLENPKPYKIEAAQSAQRCALPHPIMITFPTRHSIMLTYRIASARILKIKMIAKPRPNANAAVSPVRVSAEVDSESSWSLFCPNVGSICIVAISMPW